MTTLVIGASTKPERYSYKAINSLLQKRHHVIALGNKMGVVNGLNFILDINEIDEPIDTITLYINAKLQQKYYDAILKLKPRRVIFNQGAENEEFQDLLEQNNIEALEACTLVLLSIGRY
jgi:uncharacterized protein